MTPPAEPVPYSDAEVRDIRERASKCPYTKHGANCMSPEEHRWLATLDARTRERDEERERYLARGKRDADELVATMDAKERAERALAAARRVVEDARVAWRHLLDVDPVVSPDLFRNAVRDSEAVLARIDATLAPRPAAVESKCEACGAALADIGRVYDPALREAVDEDGNPLRECDKWQPCPTCTERHKDDLIGPPAVASKPSDVASGEKAAFNVGQRVRLLATGGYLGAGFHIGAQGTVASLGAAGDGAFVNVDATPDGPLYFYNREIEPAPGLDDAGSEAKSRDAGGA